MSDHDTTPPRWAARPILLTHVCRPSCWGAEPLCQRAACRRPMFRSSSHGFFCRCRCLLRPRAIPCLISFFLPLFLPHELSTAANQHGADHSSSYSLLSLILLVHVLFSFPV
jgi:hypothetical protein